MILPSRIALSSIFRVLALYLGLVIYSATYEYFYSTQLTVLIHDNYTAFDFSRLEIYRLICFLTPLAILPIGTRLRAPGQLIAGAAAVFIFIPIPIVFVPMVSSAEFWHVYALLWVGYFATCSLSSLAVRIRLPVVSEQGFRRGMLIFFVLLALGFLYALATNHVATPSLAKAHEATADVTVTGWQGYMLVGYITSFGGLFVAIIIMFRKYYLLPLALAGFVCCYVTLAERNAVLMPAWIAYAYLAQRFFYRDSVLKFMASVAAPFLIGVVAATLIGLEDRQSVFYDVFTLASYRLYSIPAIGFNVYYDFFSIHPLTYWSHIGVVSNFVNYPYGQPLALVMAQAYELGNDNASYLQTDGLAAAGASMLPFISIIFGLVLLAMNSCMRGLNLTLYAIVMAGSTIALVDTGLGPGLLTNGLIFLTVILLFAPRHASWNLRYLLPASSRAT
jgi:hypothetical protein